MRQLTLFPRMGNANFKHLEEIANAQIPTLFKEFMVKNAGLSHYERYFSNDETIWEVHGYEEYIGMFELFEEFIKSGWGQMLPFAFDPGGWHYCLCLNEKDYGCIFVNRWTDHLPEEQFLKIADSFEEFINGLKREDEVDL
jgi:SMI1-KNR4 cell-wall